MAVDEGENVALLQLSWTLPVLLITIAVLVLTKIFKHYRHYFTLNMHLLRKQKCDNDKKRVLGWDDIPCERRLLPTNLTGHLFNILPLSRSLEKALLVSAKYPAGLTKFTGAYQRFVVFTSPHCIQQLFKSSDFGHNVKAPIAYDLMKPFITNGLLVSTGKFWQTQRKIIMRTQSFQSLKSYMSLLNRHSETFVDELGKLFDDEKPHEINEHINVLFLKIICEMITGYNVDSSTEFNRYHHNFQIWKEGMVTRCIRPWFLWNPLWKFHPLYWRQKKAIQEMCDFATKRITEYRAKRVDKGSVDVEAEDTVKDKSTFRCLLDELLDAGIDDTQIVDEVNTMIFGGHETGATAIHFLCFSLALNQDIQEECRKEVDELFENVESVSYEAAQSKLKYVERCILETLRLFPPVFATVRQLETPFTFEHENNEYYLPIGTKVVIGTLATHRSAKHFQDPLKFDPDRFLPEAVAKRHPYSVIPFSGGPRICLGIKFAMIKMKVIVAHLLRHFVLTTTDKMEDVPLLPLVTLAPAKDYTFILRKRIIS